MRKETDDYIDAKLATFEITLQKTLQTVDRGRERLRSQMYQELAPATEAVYDESMDTGYIDAPGGLRGAPLTGLRPCPGGRLGRSEGRRVAFRRGLSRGHG